MTAPFFTDSIMGQWTISSVTTYAIDSSGILPNGIRAYPGQPGSFFQFNAQGGWLESQAPDTPTYVTIRGTFTIISDSTFTLTDSMGNSELCTLDSLTATLFDFSHQRNTLFNGTDPGVIKYVFRLTR
jgi:hypothetical protein